MSCFYGHYDSAPQSGKDVAKAFYEGRKMRRSNVETDGERYIVNGNCIAQRVDIPSRVARKLLGEEQLGYDEPDTWDFPTVRISWCGWDTWMTARHLKALGFDAEPSRYGKPAMIDGKEVPTSTWITKEEIEALPKWEPPPKRTPRERFVNLTAPLFSKEEAPVPRGLHRAEGSTARHHRDVPGLRRSRPQGAVWSEVPEVQRRWDRMIRWVAERLTTRLDMRRTYQALFQAQFRELRRTLDALRKQFQREYPKR